MDHEEIPITKGVRLLREKKIEFRPYFYRYEDHGGTTRAAVELGAPEHAVVKTLVMETDAKKPFLVLMHGDREVSTKQLARILGVKSVSPCDVAVAQRHTGYQVGGISPFGTRSPLPVYAEKGIFALPRIWINGGRRGFLVEVAPEDLRKAFQVREVEVAIIDQV